MAAILLQYDARNGIAKKTIDYILSLGVFSAKVVSPKRNALDEALDDIKHNRVFEAQNAHDLIRKCLE